MRDLIVTLLVFGSIPLIFMRPWMGIVVWTWLSLMNPHRLTWGFAVEMPYAQIIAIVTMLSLLASREEKTFPVAREVVVIVFFLVWMFITTTQAIAPGPAWEIWDKVWKIQLAVALTILLMQTRERIHWLIWTIAVSLGFFGVKGGIFVILTGGAHRVMGPQGSFIGGNNEVGLALIMVVPLLWYLVRHTTKHWARVGLYIAMFLNLVSIIGTHSRGAFLGVAVMGFVFFLRSRQKVLPLILALVFVGMVPTLMPQEWFDRMHTIETYEEDSSATERIRAWRNAIRLAKERKLGGGYEALVFYGGRDAHSIYFEVLGEHGFFGLALFLLLGALTWAKASKIRRRTRGRKDLAWAFDLASMLQISLVGYYAAGAFLGLAYFDLYYTLIAAVVLTDVVVKQHLQRQPTDAVQGPGGNEPGGWARPARNRPILETRNR